jgi:hypothetical protein
VTIILFLHTSTPKKVPTRHPKNWENFLGCLAFDNVVAKVVVVGFEDIVG